MAHVSLSDWNPKPKEKHMTIDELIERLEEYRDNVGGDAEVRLMTQQSWPFQNAVCGATSLQEIRESAADDDDEADFEAEGDAEDVIYIVEGQQLGYGTKRAWDMCH
jgi:hypothetical protein